MSRHRFLESGNLLMRFLAILVDFLVHKIKSSVAAKMPGIMLTILKNRRVLILVSGFQFSNSSIRSCCAHDNLRNLMLP